MDRDIFGMKTLGGKNLYFCNNFFVVTDIVLMCEQQQRIILQILYTHAHEVHSNLHVLEEFEVKQYEDQALVWFLRDYELPLGKCCTILEEAHDHNVTEKTNGGIFGYIILMDENCRDLAHNSSPHTSISPTSCGDENWVKGFFLLMPQEEHDTSTLPVEVLMVKPCGLKSALVVAELFPPESFSMKVCPSIDWVARHMIELCALEGKNLACINGDTLDTSKKLCEQWNEHVWLLYDAFNIHGGEWDNLLRIHNNSDMSSSFSLHMDFHTLERLKMIWSRIKEFHV